MSAITDDFGENREFLNDIRNGNTEDAIKKIIERYGPEVAKGFLMAMAYMQTEVSDAYCQYVANHWTGEDHFNINSYTVMTENISNVVSHINDLLQTGSALTGYPEQLYLDGVKVPHKKMKL